MRAWRGRAVQVILVLVAGIGLASWGSVLLNAVFNGAGGSAEDLREAAMADGGH